MIRVFNSGSLAMSPSLQDQMFRDRAAVFREQLGWDVNVDDEGWERDKYDDANPTYVIYEREDGSHGGSMRWLPMSGPTMLMDHFADIAPREALAALHTPRYLEVTRLCTTPGCDTNLSALICTALQRWACEYALASGIDGFLAVFDLPMIVVYRRAGWSPKVLGRDPETGYMVGVWQTSLDALQRLDRRIVTRRERVLNRRSA